MTLIPFPGSMKASFLIGPPESGVYVLGEWSLDMRNSVSTHMHLRPSQGRMDPVMGTKARSQYRRPSHIFLPGQEMLEAVPLCGAEGKVELKASTLLPKFLSFSLPVSLLF